MLYEVITTDIPKRISYQIILRLNTIGSIIEAKNAPVENIANAMETLATSMAPKNRITAYNVCYTKLLRKTLL